MDRERGAHLIAAAAVAAAGAAGWYAARLRSALAERDRRLAEAERHVAAAGVEGAHGARTRELLQITDAALAALPLDELLVHLLRRVCEGLPADAAALLLVDEPLGAPVLRAAHGFEPHGEAATLMPGVGLAARVSEERRAVALADAEVAEVRLTALRDMGAVAGAPLLIGSRVIGVLEVGRRAPMPFDDEDLALLQLAADRTALGVDHARMFERERHIAQTLQSSLLPGRLPAIPGVELESRFVPAGAGQEVGGDFYDVIALDGERWLLIVGDVCGKGAEAAALTAMVRYTLRAEAAHERRPGELLGLLNDAIITQRSDSTFCTLVCVLMEPVSDRWMITAAGGGHPMPLVIRADGEMEPPLDPGGPLIGVWADAEFPEHRYRLLPGDILVAYTDGLLEAHAPDRILTPEALAALAADCTPRPLEAFIRALESAALGSSIEPVRDDIAALALAVEPAAVPFQPEVGRCARPQRGPADSPLEEGSGTAGEPPRDTGCLAALEPAATAAQSVGGEGPALPRSGAHPSDPPARDMGAPRGPRRLELAANRHPRSDQRERACRPLLESVDQVVPRVRPESPVPHVLDRLSAQKKRSAAGADGTLDEFRGRIVAEVRGPDSEDDTAIAGIRWVN